MQPKSVNHQKRAARTVLADLFSFSIIHAVIAASRAVVIAATTGLLNNDRVGVAVDEVVVSVDGELSNLAFSNLILPFVCVAHSNSLNILRSIEVPLRGSPSMKKGMWISLLLVVLALIAVSWSIRDHVVQPSEVGFSLVSLKGNTLLISDADVLSYNWTSQEIALTDGASERLLQIGEDLYSFTDGFVIKIDGEELYQGVFRSPIMSAIPEPPKISIMFPSVLFPSDFENNHAVRMFFPGFQPPKDQPEKNFRLSEYFEGVNRLTR